MNALWPTAGEVDEILLASSEFGMAVARDLRLKIKNRRSLAEKKKGKELAKPDKAVIYYAESYPGWQKATIEAMRKMYDEANGQLPDNKQLAAKLKNCAETKPHMKKVMPFVALLKEQIQQIGMEKALALTSVFDQRKVLETNLKYLIDTSELEDIEIRSSDCGDAKIRDSTSPGKPNIELVVTPSVNVELRNQQACAPFHSVFLKVRDGETCVDVLQRMLKNQIHISDIDTINLSRFEDPIRGPRMMPSIDKPDDLITVNHDTTFKLDENKKQAYLMEGDKQVNIENILVYRVNNGTYQ